MLHVSVTHVPSYYMSSGNITQCVTVFAPVADRFMLYVDFKKSQCGHVGFKGHGS